MKKLLLACVVAFIVFPFSAGGQGAKLSKEAEEELAKLKGNWTVQSLTYDDGKVDGLLGKGLTQELTIRNSPLPDWKEKVGSGSAKSWHVALDPSKDPKTLDLTEAVLGKQRIKLAIYKLEGDLLTVAIGIPDGKRPEKFEPEKGTKNEIYVYKRKK